MDAYQFYIIFRNRHLFIWLFYFNWSRIAVMADITSSWSQLYSELKKNHDEAYFMIDEAIRLEMDGKQNEVC